MWSLMWMTIYDWLVASGPCYEKRYDKLVNVNKTFIWSLLLSLLSWMWLWYLCDNSISPRLWKSEQKEGSYFKNIRKGNCDPSHFWSHLHHLRKETFRYFLLFFLLIFFLKLFLVVISKIIFHKQQQYSSSSFLIFCQLCIDSHSCSWKQNVGIRVELCD